jgi:protein-S-isoprenylcysteine O-methyltransferase Ste14
MASWPRIARRWRVPLSFLMAAASLWLAQPTLLSIVIGIGFVVAGLALRAAASGHIDKDVRLAVTGPYAHTRHPLYLGSVVIALGFVIAARSGWVVLGACALFLAFYLPMIMAEENYLRATFSDYADYAARVPRFGLRLSAYRNGGNETGARFSRDLYLWHREYNAALCACLMLGALLLKLW